MKTINARNLLLAGAVLALAWATPRVLGADTNTTAKAADQSCCSDPGAVTVSLTDTNGIPDLLKTCPVSGDKLGEMGDAYKFVYKGQEVKLCCSGCKKDFLKDPKKYLALIRAADKPAKK